MTSNKTAEQRFWEKVDKTETCWLWTAGLSKGYGKFGYEGRTIGAHRISYEWAKVPIPPGLQIDHLCRVTRCVNPDHLEAVTPQVNVHRSNSPIAQNAQKTHCKAGHPLTAGNLYKRNDNKRRCAECARQLALAAWRAKYAGKKRRPPRYSPEDVAAMRAMRESGARYVDIAQSFGTTKGYVHRLVNADARKVA